VNRLRVVPIVEGHGEYHAVRKLLERIWYELLGGEYIDVLRPIREKRQRLVTDKDRALSRAVKLAARQLSDPSLPVEPGLILILIDTDRDLPCQLGSKLLEMTRNMRADMDIACVTATVEYETWFVAAAKSLSEFLDVTTSEIPTDPEKQRCGKNWIQKRFRGFKYSETVDQPKLTARMDLAVCRSRSPSFDKLCRDLEFRMQQAVSS